VVTHTRRFDLFIEALRRATGRGRSRLMATHRRLVQKRIHLPAVPPGHRLVAGRLIPLGRDPECRYPRRDST